MKNTLIYATSFALILMMSFAMAGTGGQSFRAELGGAAKVIHIGDDRNLSSTKASFSAYIPSDTAAPGKGSLNMEGTTLAGKRIRMNIKLENAVIETDSNTTLRVISHGYYYERVPAMFGFWTLRKVEGDVTYSLNKISGNTRIEGSPGFDFAVAGVPTKELLNK